MDNNINNINNSINTNINANINTNSNSDDADNINGNNTVNTNCIEDDLADFLNNCQKLLILGIGHPLRSDDGLGPFFADNLSDYIKNNINKNVSNNLVIINAGSVPENFTGKIKNEAPSHIIIVDAVKIVPNDNDNYSDNDNINSNNDNVNSSFVNKDLNRGYGANVIDRNNSFNSHNSSNINSNSNNSLNYGNIKLFGKDKIANMSISSHSMSLSFLIKYLELDISFELLIVGVVPKNMGIGVDLSPEIQESLSYLERIILNTLDL
ncbi:MAG: hypothetical protein ACRCVG_05285 [Methanobacteriaceae archaeon]